MKHLIHVSYLPMRYEENGGHFADDILIYFFRNKRIYILM